MTAAERTLALLDHLRVDEESDGVLEALVRAWTSGLERPAEVAYGEPWRALSDPAAAPLWALPHAAQWTGGTMPGRQPGESDTDYLVRARAEVVRPLGMLRGAYSALATAVRARLTGTRYVSIVERVDGNPWRLGARVREEEAPDVDALYAAANAPNAIPAGMHVDIIVAAGHVWDELGAWDDQAGAWDAT